MIIEESNILKDKLKNIINDKDFQTKFDEIEVNNNIPFTFKQEDYEVKEGRPHYTDANKFGKSGEAVAILSKRTIARYSSKNIEYPNPINYEKIVGKNNDKNGNNIGIFQKCHIIAYHLSAKFPDFNNIFIGTENLNNGAMKRIEDDIANKIEQNERKIIYKVTPVYMFKKDIVPFGVLFEYESMDKKEKICGCKFCYNIQENHKINYFDGSDRKIEDISMKDEDNFIKLENKSNVSSKRKMYKNYYLNIKDNVFHLVYDEKEKSEDLKGVYIRCIQEVTGKKEEILTNKDFSICKKCEEKYNEIFDKESSDN